MTPQHILICPLNWGLGHAGRMIPLATELKNAGHIITFAADLALIPVLKAGLPGAACIEFPGIRIRYSEHLPQYLGILLHLPHIIVASVREHYSLRRITGEIKPDIIISDNRFGLWHREIFSVYITHMLRIPFPAAFRFLEPVAAWLHRMIIRRYDLCMIPDYPGSPNLTGRLSHGTILAPNCVFTGPLSRFSVPASISALTCTSEPYNCLVLSGPEPQRSILRDKVIDSFTGKHLVVISSTTQPAPVTSQNNITVVTNPDTEVLRHYLMNSDLIICRPGYTTIMELVSLRKSAVLIPTPGQTEQEYLCRYLNEQLIKSPYRYPAFTVLRQKDVGKTREPAGCDVSAYDCFPDSRDLLENALSLLKKKYKE